MAKASDLLLEYRQEGSKTWAIRFYTDGLVKEFNDSEMTFEDDKIVTHTRPLAWRELTKLSPAGLKKLLAALRKAEFFALPDQLGDPTRLKDGTRFTWMMNLNGQKKTVVAFGPQASSSPSLKMLGEMVQEVTADAFDLDAKDAGTNS